MKSIDSNIIAEANDLQVIETTTSSNGYPATLKQAIIGFSSFDQAEKIARENGLSIQYFTKRDGWSLYYRNGNTAWEAFEVDASDYGDDYLQFSKNDLGSFYEDEIKPLLDDCGTLEELKDLIEKKEEIKDNIEALEDGEKVLTYQGRYYDTIATHCMSYTIDGETNVIGLIED